MSKLEFVFLCAALMAMNALAIDIMLPALQQIGEALNVVNENHRQYVVTSYLIGFGCAQLVYGPLSDRFGRRTPMLIGLIVYVLAALAITIVPSFAGLLILRFIQGAGSAGTRVITISIVRDVYGGRQMAEVMSLIMMVFMIIPVIAPGTGQIIMFFGNWHLIFLFIAVGGILTSMWMHMRLPETLTPENRREFTPKVIFEGFKIVLTNRIALFYTLASTFIFGALFGFINSAQQIYMGIYGLGVWFPFAFAAVAIFMALSSYVNSKLVGRIGMRRLSHGSLLGFITINALWLMAETFGPTPLPFVVFMAFFAVSMFQFGWIGGNFQTLAIEPLGHVAGTASSVLGFISTIGGSVLGAIVGQAFDGTSRPLVAGYFFLGVIGLVFVLIAEKGKLFQPHNPKV
ncbi:Bcr/CflA family efflux MFS transporter [Agrobacterium vitis]|uniref:Bcr/CflA family efflux transporter n=1 Tax=Agrobacterium vitis TaxID=373 RepID=A0ABD6GIC1_AGRVI|nr:multidrug effflux MFS transporter [Agrobacterium vitis]MCF1455525.1 multidrug effflux MFS transporter [Agrobacterium vitis]MUO80919.1 Bcr/CflA family efflux MFS transporter [Agrobacterium vitis]MUO97414.1 Bcr/CflA family efflux MFS transporter [Agrobacterium vitis]MUP06554.1 Bcr/CflA family efflux MFS transporter [Agrobacterium vitis]MUZ84158.1 Bcr/CflA family efflux MFS transporter [Agrobacterium vitis]